MNTLKKISDYRARHLANVVRLPSRAEPGSLQPRLKEIPWKEERLPKPALASKSQAAITSAPAECHSLPAKVQAARPITLMVADDHPVVREGLITIIERQMNMQVTAEAADGREAVEVFMAGRPDVGLLDLRMPGMSGVEAVTAICEKAPAARLIILTTYQAQEDIYRALRAGALGYLLKDAPTEELVQAIRAVNAGETWIPPAVGAMLAKRLTDRELTRREKDVLRILAAGKSNKEIGVAFDISEATVKVHVTHILEKLKVTGRTEAMNVAVRRGLVSLDSAAA